MCSFILKTEKLCKSFSNGGNQQHILKNIDMEIIEGDFTVIMGSSGSGKSTLLYALSGMDKPTLGKVLFQNTDIAALNNDQLAVFRRRNCGFVFQGIYLCEHMSVLDNILASALLITNDTKKAVKRAKDMLLEVGIEEKLWNKFPAQLSGGESQRVGIVRALMNQPQIVFADEPTGALNSAAGIDVLNVFTKVNQNKQSLVVVTHDLKTAMRGNRILYMKDGKISGELKLPVYQEEHLEERRNKLQNFLIQMGW